MMDKNEMNSRNTSDPVALAEISGSCCRGLTCSLSLKLALLVEGPSTFSITQEMFGESLLKAC